MKREMWTALGVGAIAACATGQPALPLFWSWNEAPSESNNPHVIPLIRVDVTFRFDEVSAGPDKFPNYHGAWRRKSGSEMADYVVTMIQRLQRDQGLTDEIAILFQGFGRGGLPRFIDTAELDPTANCTPQIVDGSFHANAPAVAFHPKDALRIDALAWNCALSWKQQALYLHTPWMKNGINDSKAWVADFIARYQDLQANPMDFDMDDGFTPPPLPDPMRFHMDSENSFSNCCDTSWVAAFDYMITTDNRRDSPAWPIPGFFDSNGSPMTLEEIWLEGLAQHPNIATYDPTKFIFESVNQEWHIWWMTVVNTALEAAMDEVLYSQVRAAWPNVKTSEYWRSVRTDGSLLGGRRIRDYNAPGAPPFGEWRQIPGRGPLLDRHMMSPVMYFSDDGFVHCEHLKDSAGMPTGESRLQATLRLFREALSACSDSNFGLTESGNPYITELVPWLSQVNQYFDVDQSRRVLSLARSENPSEINIWSDLAPNTQQNWNSLTDLIHQVWGTQLEQYSILFGTDPGASLSDLEFDDQSRFQAISDLDLAALTPSERVTIQLVVDTTALASIGVDFAALSPTLLLEGDFWTRAAPSSTFSSAIGLISVKNVTTQAFDLIHTYFSGSTPNRLALLISDSSLYIDGNGDVTLQFEYSAPGNPLFPEQARFEFVSDSIQLVGANANASLGEPGDSCPMMASVLGDVTDDGFVDMIDLRQLMRSFGLNTSQSDLNDDHIVDVLDLSILLNNWTGEGRRDGLENPRE